MSLEMRVLIKINSELVDEIECNDIAEAIFDWLELRGYEFETVNVEEIYGDDPRQISS